jgi:hypothetical protein
MRGRQELAERARFADDGRHLRAGGRQRVDDILAGRAVPPSAAPARPAAGPDRRWAPSEGVIRILAGFNEYLNADGPWRFHHLGRQCLADEAREALRQLHADAADAFGPQADRRGEH